MADPIPTEIKLRTKSRVLEVVFDNGERFELSFEYLRVYSPSAEVRGHGPGQETLQLGKHEVGIKAVEPVGHYAVRLVFDDGHDTGLYSWSYLRELGHTRGEVAAVLRQVRETRAALPHASSHGARDRLDAGLPSPSPSTRPRPLTARS
jgi:DUF971 family protein